MRDKNVSKRFEGDKDTQRNESVWENKAWQKQKKLECTDMSQQSNVVEACKQKTIWNREEGGGETAQ